MEKLSENAVIHICCYCSSFDYKAVAKAGGSAAKAAKDSIEESTGKSVITSKKAAELNHMVTAMIEKSAEIE